MSLQSSSPSLISRRLKVSIFTDHKGSPLKITTREEMASFTKRRSGDHHRDVTCYGTSHSS